MLKHVFKVPLHSRDLLFGHTKDAATVEAIGSGSAEGAAAALPKRTLWRLMTVQPTSINLKSFKIFFKVHSKKTFKTII